MAVVIDSRLIAGNFWRVGALHDGVRKSAVSAGIRLLRPEGCFSRAIHSAFSRDYNLAPGSFRPRVLATDSGQGALRQAPTDGGARLRPDQVEPRRQPLLTPRQIRRPLGGAY